MYALLRPRAPFTLVLLISLPHSNKFVELPVTIFVQHNQLAMTVDAYSAPLMTTEARIRTKLIRSPRRLIEELEREVTNQGHRYTIHVTSNPTSTKQCHRY